MTAKLQASFFISTFIPRDHNFTCFKSNMNMHWVLNFLYCSVVIASNHVGRLPQRARKDNKKARSLKTLPPLLSSTNSPSISLVRSKESPKTNSAEKSIKKLCKTSKKSVKSLKKGTKKSFKNTDCNYNITNPTATPRLKATFTPSLSPTVYNCTKPINRNRDINEIIASVSSTIIPGTPQDLALQWLLNNDTSTNACGGGDRIRQRFALAVFFFSTNGFNWTIKTSWLGPTDECAWYGLNCVDGMVTSLEMDLNNLSGALPKEVAALRDLSELHVFNNSIGGTLPTELGSLPNLTLLDLEVNRMQGTLFRPELLKTAGTLKYLRGSNNNFVGTIPTWIGNLTGLDELWATGNSLTGSIPDEITRLTGLGSLILYDNKLTGTIPSNIGALSNLKEMDLSNNLLHGTIPSSIGSMSSLNRLVLENDNLVGTIPEAISSFTYLTKINLAKNSLTGTIPEGFSTLQKLVFILLNDNNLNGTLPDFISPDLYYLDVSGNTLGGSIKSDLFLLPSLTNLYLSNNTFSGTIPSSFGDSTSLTAIWLDGNQLNGTVPDVPIPDGWPLIHDVLLEHNLLVGSIPESICSIRAARPATFITLHADCQPPTLVLGQAQINCANGCCTACFLGVLV